MPSSSGLFIYRKEVPPQPLNEPPTPSPGWIPRGCPYIGNFHEKSRRWLCESLPSSKYTEPPLWPAPCPDTPSAPTWARRSIHLASPSRKHLGLCAKEMCDAITPLSNSVHESVPFEKRQPRIRQAEADRNQTVNARRPNNMGLSPNKMGFGSPVLGGFLLVSL